MPRRAVVSFAVVAVLGCSRSPGRPHGEQESRAMSSSSSPPVTLVSTGAKLEKPPRIRVLLDVRVRNEAAEPRWFLLPNHAGSSPVQAVVISALVYQLGPSGDVPIVDFTGSPGFWALLLPVGGDVRVRGLPISATYADLDAGEVSLDVMIARDFSVGGDPPRAWFGGDPTTAASADVPWSIEQVRQNRQTPGLAGITPAIAVERHMTITVAVALTR